MKFNYAFLSELADLPFVSAIYLFGSRARGDHSAKADIDLAIVCPLASDVEWQSIMDIIDKADTLLKIDCVRWDKIINQELKDNIEREKIILFQREQPDAEK